MASFRYRFIYLTNVEEFLFQCSTSIISLTLVLPILTRSFNKFQLSLRRSILPFFPYENIISVGTTLLMCTICCSRRVVSKNLLYIYPSLIRVLLITASFFN